MRYLLNSLTALILCGLIVFCHTSVHAVPPLPSSFYGTVELDGEGVQEGTSIKALINNQVFAAATSQIYQGDSVYSLIVPGDDPSTSDVEGGKEGNIITFLIDGSIADQTGAWNSGGNQNLDLTTSKGDPKASSTPTQTLTLTPTYNPQQTKTKTITPSKTETIPEKSSTPKPSTATNQFTPSNSQTLSATRTKNHEDDRAPSTSEGILTSSPEVFLQTQDPNSKETMVIVNKISESNLSTSSSTSESIEPVKTINWLHFGVPAVILIGLGAGIWYLRKNNKSDDLLL